MSTVRPRQGRRVLIVAGIMSLSVLAAGCVGSGGPESESSATAVAPVLPDSQVQPLLVRVPHKSVGSVPTMRLAEGLVPPTNRWFSGLVFGDVAQPVFPLPLSFRLTSSGFSFGVPTITSSPGLIAGPMTDHVKVETAATGALVTRYDDVSVTVTLSSPAAALADVTIARGSLVVGYRALAAHDLTMAVAMTPTKTAGVYRTTIAGAEYGLVAPGGTLSADGRILSLPAEATATWFAVPKDGTFDALARFVTGPVTGVEVDYGLAGAGDTATATTTLHYRTTGDKPTLVGMLPHQSDRLPVGNERCDLGTFDTTYGVMTVCASTAVSYAVPDRAPPRGQRAIRGRASRDCAGLERARPQQARRI